MFKNVGKKIKTFSVVMFIIEALAALVCGIGMIITSDYLIPYGVLVALVGPFVLWILSWFVYGYGELIDKTCEIAKNTQPVKAEPKSEVEVTVD